MMNLKRLFVLLCSVILAISMFTSCEEEDDNNLMILLLSGSSGLFNYVYPLFSLDSFDSLGSISVVSESSGTVASSGYSSLAVSSGIVASSGYSSLTVSSGEIEYLYITGKSGDSLKGIVELRIEGSEQEERTVVLKSESSHTSAPPSAYPSAFIMNGERYLLFLVGQSSFGLYKKTTETESEVHYEKETIWDFNNITNYVTSIMYYGQNRAWIITPDYNDTRKTLYFTLAYLQEPTVTTKNDLKMRIYESQLTDNVFETPQETIGAINPYNPIHYIDGQWHDDNDFPGNVGWIGRMYVTEDGTKAFFNCLNVFFPEDYGILKPDDPYITPTPNYKNWGDCGVTDQYDPRLIYSTVYSADINEAGEFENLQLLPDTINRGGINVVSDISDDGSKIYISHMELDDYYFAYGMGAGGIARSISEMAPYDVEVWRGYVDIFTKNGSSWEYSESMLERIGDEPSAKWLEEKEKWDNYDETSFRASHPWVHSSATITPTYEHGRIFYNIIDNPDMTFVNDANVIGTWETCDMVWEISDFIPGERQHYSGVFQMTGVRFQSDGTYDTKYVGDSDYRIGVNNWTSGLLRSTAGGAPRVWGQEYTLQQDGSDWYILIQNKDGTYYSRATKPNYYVFQKQ